jgi:hypothetical protein
VFYCYQNSLAQTLGRLTGSSVRASIGSGAVELQGRKRFGVSPKFGFSHSKGRASMGETGRELVRNAQTGNGKTQSEANRLTGLWGLLNQWLWLSIGRELVGHRCFGFRRVGLWLKRLVGSQGRVFGLPSARERSNCRAKEVWSKPKIWLFPLQGSGFNG